MDIVFINNQIPEIPIDPIPPEKPSTPAPPINPPIIDWPPIFFGD